MKKETLYKVITFSLIAIVVLWVLQGVFSGGRMFAPNYGGYFMGEHSRGGMYMMNGGLNFGFGGTLTYLFMFLIKILFVVFIIGIVGAVIVWVKNNVFTAEDKENIKNLFTAKTNPQKKDVCSECGKELKAEWKACPYCGKEKTVNNQ